MYQSIGGGLSVVSHFVRKLLVILQQVGLWKTEANEHFCNQLQKWQLVQRSTQIKYSRGNQYSNQPGLNWNKALQNRLFFSEKTAHCHLTNRNACRYLRQHIKCLQISALYNPFTAGICYFSCHWIIFSFTFFLCVVKAVINVNHKNM